jgi:hypothetical protein
MTVTKAIEPTKPVFFISMQHAEKSGSVHLNRDSIPQYGLQYKFVARFWIGSPDSRKSSHGKLAEIYSSLITNTWRGCWPRLASGEHNVACRLPEAEQFPVAHAPESGPERFHVEFVFAGQVVHREFSGCSVSSSA